MPKQSASSRELTIGVNFCKTSRLEPPHPEHFLKSCKALRVFEPPLFVRCNLFFPTMKLSSTV